MKNRGSGHKGLTRDPIQGEVTVFWNPYGTKTTTNLGLKSLSH